MSWTLITSAGFDRRARRFLKRHPDLRPCFVGSLENLRTNPFDPSLRLHQLGGKLKDLHAVSLTYSYRIVLVLRVMEYEILLIDVGSHDEVYG